MLSTNNRHKGIISVVFEESNVRPLKYFIDLVNKWFNWVLLFQKKRVLCDMKSN